MFSKIKITYCYLDDNATFYRKINKKMLSSVSELLAPVERITEKISTVLPMDGRIIGAFLIFAVLTRVNLKLLKSAMFKGVGRISVSAPQDSAADASNGNGGSGYAEEEEAQKNEELEAEKQKEKEQLLAQEQMKELFALTHDENAKPKQRIQKEQEKEKLGRSRKDMEKLREKYKGLTTEIAAMLEKGLTGEQTARAMISRTADLMPLLELQALIDAMELFVKKNENAAKNTAVIGMDPQFEQRAAFSALKRGEFETALGFLERQAAEESNKISSSHRNEAVLERAGNLYRALGVLNRPIDAEKSFDALKKSQELSPENTITSALIAQAYYESGKKDKAAKAFENIAQKSNANTIASQYAHQMMTQMKTQEVMQQASRIRKEYERRLGDAEGRQKTENALSLQQRKRREVFQANNRFSSMEDLRDRDNEHIRG